MAARRPDARHTALRALLLAAAAVLPMTPVAAGEAPREIVIDADGIQINYQTNTLRMPNVEISQETPRGRLSIRADEATARGSEPRFDNSEWEFRGAVRIEYEGAELNASSATVSFVRNRINHALVLGSPATFSHLAPDSKQRRQGRARSIEFDMPLGQLRLEGDAWFSDGSNEVTTEAIVYNMNDRSMENVRGPDPGNRVRMTIRPESLAPPDKTIPVRP